MIRHACFFIFRSSDKLGLTLLSRAQHTSATPAGAKMPQRAGNDRRLSVLYFSIHSGHLALPAGVLNCRVPFQTPEALEADLLADSRRNTPLIPPLCLSIQ